MEPVLPEPDLTIMIPENTVNPFDHMTAAIIEWLKNHDDAEDVLVGEHANPEGLKGYDELKLLGPHPYLERQMTHKAPRRWLHLKLQMLVNPDHWLRLILRADNLYVKGVANRPGNLGLKCFEISEPEVDGVPGERANLLFPKEYKATALDWDLKYHQILSCKNDKDVIQQLLQEIWADPAFTTNAIEFWSFHDPTVEGSPGRRILGAITFKLCEFLRMRLTLDSPNLLPKVWQWGDVCVGLKGWKISRYTDIRWVKKFEKLGITEPRDGLELIQLVLNYKDGAFLYAEGKKAKKAKQERNLIQKQQQKQGTNDSRASKIQDNKGIGGHDGKAAGTSKDENRDNCSDIDYIPLGRSRIQILSICSNFLVDDIDVWDWHRPQKVYVNRLGCIGQEDKMTDLLLCGPRRVIGAYGYFGFEVFPSESIADPAIKRRKTSTGTSQVTRTREVISKCWNADDYDDSEPSTHLEELCGNADRRVVVKYLHIPNAIEANVEIRLYFDDACKVSGFIKASASGYGSSYVELFRKENDTLSVGSGAWTTIPLLVHAICFPYSTDLQLTIELDLELVAQSNEGRPANLICAIPFRTKYEKCLREFDNKGKYEVTVEMFPDPNPVD